MQQPIWILGGYQNDCARTRNGSRNPGCDGGCRAR
jgi:hypothetical protein